MFKLTQADNKQNATTASWYNSLVWKWQGIKNVNNLKRKDCIKHEARKCTNTCSRADINCLLSAPYAGINLWKLEIQTIMTGIILQNDLRKESWLQHFIRFQRSKWLILKESWFRFNAVLPKAHFSFLDLTNYHSIIQLN